VVPRPLVFPVAPACPVTVSKQNFPTCAAWLRRAAHGAIDLHGKRFGRLVVLLYAGYRKATKDLLWLCQCDCGERSVVRGVSLVHNDTKSCGCGFIDAVRRHGHTKNGTRSRTMSSYWAMRKRCEDPKDVGYKNYGGRGIKICDRWLGTHGFEQFLADMGKRPIGRTLDRKDVNGNYELSNCRWATPKQQTGNRRTSKKWKQAAAAQLITDAEVAMGIKEII